MTEDQPKRVSKSASTLASALMIPLLFSGMYGSAFGIGLGGGGRSSYMERHDPDREKTQEDLKHIEAARQKRERKAKKKL